MPYFAGIDFSINDQGVIKSGYRGIFECTDKNRYRLFFIKVENEFAVNDLKQFEIVSRQDIDSLVKNGEAIEYDSYEVDSKEILYNFGLLYSVVKEKSIGIDKVFNEILEV